MPLSKSDLIKGADSIVVGRVIEEYSDWDPSGRFIMTYIRIKVLEDIKGAENGAPEITIKKAGGKVGDREMIVHGAPRFKEGEKTLLFLRKGLSDLGSVMGLSLGKLRIIKDRYSGEEVAVNPGDSDLKFLKMEPNGKYVQGERAEIWKPALLRDLIDEIKAGLSEAQDGPR